MEAFVRSIEFVKLDEDKSYFKIKLVDKDGTLIGYFGDSKINDDINFRKETFGILAACDCFNLLKLSTNKILELPVYVEYDSYDRINSIINMDGDGLSFLGDGYGIKKYNLEKFNRVENRGKILGITSQSGTFGVFIMTEVFGTYYVTGSVYAGFGYPLGSYEIEPYYINLATKNFRTFIESILRLYKTNDLLLLGGSDEINYPKVLVKIDSKGNIIAIGNEKNEYYLGKNGNSYEIIEGNLNVQVDTSDLVYNNGIVNGDEKIYELESMMNCNTENDNDNTLTRGKKIISSLKRVLRRRR